jgi:hypothetical protein
VNLAPITSFLDEFGSDVTAAFIYGSVAWQHIHQGSDIDCFIVTAGEVPAPLRQYIRAEFVELQRSLGFTPDIDYPVEVFSVAACRTALSGQTLALILAEALAAGRVRPDSVETDELEILRALLDKRLVLRPAPALDSLTTQAHAVLARYTASEMQTLRRAIRIVHTEN